MKTESIYIVIWSEDRQTPKDLKDARKAARKWTTEPNPPAWIMCGSFLLVRKDRIALAINLFP